VTSNTIAKYSKEFSAGPSLSRYAEGLKNVAAADLKTFKKYETEFKMVTFFLMLKRLRDLQERWTDVQCDEALKRQFNSS
jgi:hypothetical protein